MQTPRASHNTALHHATDRSTQYGAGSGSVRLVGGTTMRAYWVVCGLQSLVLVVLLFGDIGFDKPGKFGLDWDHYLILLVVLVGLTISAVTIVVRRDRWNYLPVQFLLLALVIVVLSIETQPHEPLSETRPPLPEKAAE